MAFLLGSVTEGLFSGAKNMAAIMDEFETSKDKAKMRAYADSVQAEMEAKKAAKAAAAKPKSEGGAPVDTGTGTTNTPSASGGVDPAELDKAVPTSRHLGGTGEPAKPAVPATALPVRTDPLAAEAGMEDATPKMPDTPNAPTVIPPVIREGTGSPEGSQQTSAAPVYPSGNANVLGTGWDPPGAAALGNPDSALNRGLRAAGSAVVGALGFGGSNPPSFDPYRGAYRPQSTVGQEIAAQPPPVSGALMSTEPAPSTGSGWGVFPQRGATPTPNPRQTNRPPYQPGVYLTPGSLTGGQSSSAPATAMPSGPVYDPTTGTWIQNGRPTAAPPR